MSENYELIKATKEMDTLLSEIASHDQNLKNSPYLPGFSNSSDMCIDKNLHVKNKSLHNSALSDYERGKCDYLFNKMVQFGYTPVAVANIQDDDLRNSAIMALGELLGDRHKMSRNIDKMYKEIQVLSAKNRNLEDQLDQYDVNMEKERDRLEREVDECKHRLDIVEDEKDDLLEELKLANIESRSFNGKEKQLTIKINRLTSYIAELEDKIRGMYEDYDKISIENQQLIRDLRMLKKSQVKNTNNTNKNLSNNGIHTNYLSRDKKKPVSRGVDGGGDIDKTSSNQSTSSYVNTGTSTTSCDSIKSGGSDGCDSIDEVVDDFIQENESSDFSDYNGRNYIEQTNFYRDNNRDSVGVDVGIGVGVDVGVGVGVDDDSDMIYASPLNYSIDLLLPTPIVELNNLSSTSIDTSNIVNDTSCNNDNNLIFESKNDDVGVDSPSIGIGIGINNQTDTDTEISTDNNSTNIQYNELDTNVFTDNTNIQDNESDINTLSDVLGNANSTNIQYNEFDTKVFTNNTNITNTQLFTNNILDNDTNTKLTTTDTQLFTDINEHVIIDNYNEANVNFKLTPGRTDNIINNSHQPTDIKLTDTNTDKLLDIFIDKLTDINTDNSDKDKFTDNNTSIDIDTDNIDQDKSIDANTDKLTDTSIKINGINNNTIDTVFEPVSELPILNFDSNHDSIDNVNFGVGVGVSVGNGVDIITYDNVDLSVEIYIDSDVDGDSDSDNDNNSDSDDSLI